MSERTEKPPLREARAPLRPNRSLIDTPDGTWRVPSSTTDMVDGGAPWPVKISSPAPLRLNRPCWPTPVVGSFSAVSISAMVPAPAGTATEMSRMREPEASVKRNLIVSPGVKPCCEAAVSPVS
ncbi:hypothetical protein D3C72_1527190 [compost metagenome]